MTKAVCYGSGMKVETAPSTQTPDVTQSDSGLIAGSDRAVTFRLAGLTKRYGSATAVNDVDLTVGEGEIVALLGPSGCGKTTTLRLIAGFEEPDAGLIEIAGQRVAEGRHFVPPERRRVGMVFQDYALFPHLTVGQNVAFGLPRDRDRQDWVEDALNHVGLTGLSDRMPYQLSGGQQQRVALARAIAPRPNIILLDEPFSNLDPHLRSRVREDVREILNRVNATAILVTHDQEEALSLADRIAVMFAGHIEQVAVPETLYHRPINRAVAEFVGDALLLEGDGRGDQVETLLGTLPVVDEAVGSVHALIRPEMLRVLPGTNESQGVRGEIRRGRFFGRDQLLSIEIAGQLIEARVENQRRYEIGEAVRVGVRGPVVCFPAIDR